MQQRCLTSPSGPPPEAGQDPASDKCCSRLQPVTCRSTGRPHPVRSRKEWYSSFMRMPSERWSVTTFVLRPSSTWRARGFRCLSSLRLHQQWPLWTFPRQLRAILACHAAGAVRILKCRTLTSVASRMHRPKFQGRTNRRQGPARGPICRRPPAPARRPHPAGCEHPAAQQPVHAAGT